MKAVFVDSISANLNIHIPADDQDIVFITVICYTRAKKHSHTPNDRVDWVSQEYKDTDVHKLPVSWYFNIMPATALLHMSTFLFVSVSWRNSEFEHWRIIPFTFQYFWLVCLCSCRYFERCWTEPVPQLNALLVDLRKVRHEPWLYFNKYAYSSMLAVLIESWLLTNKMNKMLLWSL